VQLKNRGVKLLNPKTERKQREECLGGRAKAVKPLTFLTPDFLKNRQEDIKKAVCFATISTLV
jgi:hypothetical protein